MFNANLGKIDIKELIHKVVKSATFLGEYVNKRNTSKALYVLWFWTVFKGVWQVTGPGRLKVILWKKINKYIIEYRWTEHLMKAIVKSVLNVTCTKLGKNKWVSTTYNVWGMPHTTCVFLIWPFHPGLCWPKYFKESYLKDCFHWEQNLWLGCEI